MTTIAAPESMPLEALDERTLEILERRRSSGRIRRRGWLVRRALLAADLIGFSIAFAVAQAVFARAANRGVLDQSAEFVAFGLSLPLWIVAAKLYGLYQRDEEHADHSTADEFAGLFHLVTVCAAGFFTVAQLTRLFHVEFAKLLLFWCVAIPVLLFARGMARAICRHQIDYLQNTVIVGAGRTGQALASKLLNHPEYGLNLVGFIDSRPMPRDDSLDHLAILGGLDELPKFVGLLDVERVIVAFSLESHERLLSIVSSLRHKDVQIDIVPRLFESLGPSVSLHPIEGIPLVSVPPLRLARSSLVLKRCLDVAVSTVALVVSAPILLAIAAAVRLETPGPVLYRHSRIGRNGARIRVLKFRSMHLEMCRGADYGGEEAEVAFTRLMSDPELRREFETAYKLRDDPRVTRVGGFLRRTSLDELPQLWNVLRGDLSLVGPRALTEDELSEHYAETSESLLATRPGVTGYWQINGRSQLAYADRVRLDMAYIRGWSLGLDLEILAKTVRVMLSSRGAV